jgi:Tol biopolymer transport system component
MYWEAGWDSIVVATADGKRLSVYTPQSGEYTPDQWLAGNRLFGSSERHPTAIGVVPMSGGTSRLLTDTLGAYSEPRWSPDGRRIAIVSQRPSEFILMNADGSSRKVIHQTHPIAVGNSFVWSPDGRSILYAHRDSGLSIIDVSTGAEREGASETTCQSPRWRSDSRAVLYVTSPGPKDADSTLMATFHEKTIGGAVRVLRSSRVESPYRRGCNATVIGDSAAVTWDIHQGKYTVIDLFTQTEPRLLFQRPAQQSVQRPVPSVSSDGRWVSVRREAADGQTRIVELFRADGSAKRTVTVPFPIAHGMFNPRIMNDGTELIVASGPQGNGPRQYYHVDVASGNATKLAMLGSPSDPDGTGVGSISPDAKSILYATKEPTLVSFFEIDATAMLKGATKQK